MPRVYHVKKARKDNPVAKKGESYYWWKFRYGGKRFSKTYPRQSQLTQSDKKGRLLEVQESLTYGTPESAEELRDFLREAAETIREVGEEYRESADNQREYFPDSNQAEEWEEWAGECDGLADEIEELAGQEFDDDEAFIEAVEDIDWRVPYW